MASEVAVRPLGRCLKCIRQPQSQSTTRAFSQSYRSRLDTKTTDHPASEAPPPPASRSLDPNIVSSPRTESRLIRTQGIYPIGSRRRRAAIASTGNIPFSQLPYQCFQEARAFLQEDRKEKLEAIRVQRSRLQKLVASEVEPQDEFKKENRVRSMKHHLEELKIFADINDPLVKKRFEDGEGDMSKPIYRHLANLKWRSYKRPLLMQRIIQMNVVPDVLPVINPVVSTTVSFPPTYKRVQHGDFVDSALSENPPILDIQPYDRGERLYTIAVMNSDVPDVGKDGFDYRCHFLASNVPISPTDTRVDLAALSDETQVVLPWLPPYAQKGAPYQRMSIFILQQPGSDSQALSLPSQTLDVQKIQAEGRYTERLGLKLRSYETKYALKPVGVDLFRTKWDENTAGVMERAKVPGWNVEFRRKRVEPLPYQRKKGERYR